MAQPHLSTPKNMKTFFVIWLGQLFSVIGSGLTGFALGVWIFQETGQATPFALTVLFASLPRILLTPLAGSLADRWNRRWLMIIADSGAALTTLVVIFLLMGGRLEIWHIYVVAAVASAFAAFQEPAYTASITMLVPKSNLARANGMVHMTQAFEMLAAPVLAGLLFGVVGLQGIILIDFATYFFALGALLVVRIPQPKDGIEPGEARPSVWKDAKFGWSYLKARPGLFGLLMYFALVNFLMNSSTVLTGPLVLSFSSPEVLGLVNTTMGAGMLVGSLIMSAWGGPKKRIKGILLFAAVASVGLGFAGLQPTALTIAAGMFLLLLSVPFASGMSQALFQSKIEPGVQGRVFAVRTMISRSLMPLAFLLAGPLADRVFEPLMAPGGSLADSFLGIILGTGPGRGIGLMFTISGMILVAATLLAYSNPRIRRLEDELPDAVLEEKVMEGGEAPGFAPAD
jgi:MFS transporter, DHA3 family, macrolide efflux protein